MNNQTAFQFTDRQHLVRGPSEALEEDRQSLTHLIGTP